MHAGQVVADDVGEALLVDIVSPAALGQTQLVLGVPLQLLHYSIPYTLGKHTSINLLRHSNQMIQWIILKIYNHHPWKLVIYPQ